MIRRTLLLALLAAPLGAQQQPLTEHQAVRLALARSPAAIVAAARGAMLVGAARQAAAYGNPVLDWRRENLGSALQRDEFLTVSVPVDLVGRRLALRGAIGATRVRARADSALAAREVAVRAARAWWRAALARDLLAVAVDQRVAAESLAAFDSTRCREGEVAEVVALRTAAEAERARLAEATARGEWHRARGELAVALALPSDSLPALAAMPAVDTTPRALTEYAAERALAFRPELRALHAAIDAARARQAAAWRGTLGDLAITGGTKRTAGIDTRVLGITVPIPLLDRNGAARQLAGGEVRALEAERDLVERAVVEEVQAAVGALRALQSGLPAASDAGAEAAAIMRAAYREGGATLTEVIDAQRAAAEQRATRLRWRAELRLAQVEVARAMGNDECTGWVTP